MDNRAGQVAPINENRVAAGLILIGGGHRKWWEDKISQHQVLLGRRKNEPYRGLLSFPAGKPKTGEDIQPYLPYDGWYSGLSTALRESEEETGINFERESLRYPVDRTFGYGFAVYDPNTDFTIYVTPIHNPFFEKKRYNWLLREESDLENPRFYTVEEIRRLKKQGALAFITMPAIQHSFDVIKKIEKERNDELNYKIKHHLSLD